MSRCIPVLTMVVAVAFLGGIAQAELVSFTTDADCASWSPSGAVVSQAISGPALVTINAESHSKFTITNTTTNETSFVWTGYVLTLDPAENATFVDGSAGSTKFNNDAVQYPDLWTVIFSAPSEVGIGEVVTLQFDVDIPDGGPYKFSLSQQPIPEPATLAVLGLGSAIVVLRKRRV